LASAQKSGAGVPAYTRYVNRPLGRVVAAAAWQARMTPNQVTVASGLLSLAALLLMVLAAPSWPVSVLVWFGMAAGYVLDSADGQLARLTGGGSLSGEWLDHVVDAVRTPAVHIAVLVALFRFRPDLAAWYLLIPLGYLLVGVVRFFALNLAEQMRRYVTGRTQAPRAVSASPVRSILALPGDFGVLCLVFVVWASAPVYLLLYGLLFAGNVVLLIPSLRRRFVELRTITVS
jgi:phosphatidylglycerophosphate synthase